MTSTNDAAPASSTGAAPMRDGTVYVIVLNWRGWRDTIECLESLCHPTRPSYRLVVCDNGSGDESVARIGDWARARADLSFAQLSRDEAELPPSAAPRPDLALIEVGQNTGFAAGNNIGLRYALADPHAAYFWVLNNDTVVLPGAVEALVARCRADPTVGICGSRLMWHAEPRQLQCAGGSSYDWSRARSRMLAEPDLSAADVEAMMDHVAGAAMFVTRPFLEQVGLMSEDYFVYFEEIDWAMRAKDRFRLAYAEDSVVLHKEGRSIGSDSRARPSDFAMVYITRNRLAFTRKFAASRLMALRRRLFVEAAIYAKRRDFVMVRLLLATMLRDLVRRPIPASEQALLRFTRTKS